MSSVLNYAAVSNVLQLAMCYIVAQWAVLQWVPGVECVLACSASGSQLCGKRAVHCAVNTGVQCSLYSVQYNVQCTL